MRLNSGNGGFAFAVLYFSENLIGWSIQYQVLPGRYCLTPFTQALNLHSLKCRRPRLTPPHCSSSSATRPATPGTVPARPPVETPAAPAVATRAAYSPSPGAASPSCRTQHTAPRGAACALRRRSGNGPGTLGTRIVPTFLRTRSCAERAAGASPACGPWTPGCP